MDNGLEIQTDTQRIKHDALNQCFQTVNGFHVNVVDYAVMVLTANIVSSTPKSMNPLRIKEVGHHE